MIAFPPSAAITACDGQIQDWNLYPLRAALEHGLIPLVYGDVAFDTRRGGTILSTEDIFDALARIFLPQRVLLAGLEEGVWADFPRRDALIATITPQNIHAQSAAIQGSAATDVTGGMLAKVESMLNLVRAAPGLEVLIFSGLRPGLVQRALLGETVGTVIRGSETERGIE